MIVVPILSADETIVGIIIKIEKGLNIPPVRYNNKQLEQIIYEKNQSLEIFELVSFYTKL